MKSASTPFLRRSSARRPLEAVKDLGQHLCENLGGGLTDVGGAFAGAAVVATEVDVARQRSCLEQPAELVLVPALTELLLGDERRRSSPFVSRSLRASISFERKSSTVSRSMASFSGTAQKTPLRSCWLRLRSSDASV